MKINALKEMVGAVVPEVSGTIIKLWPRKNGATNGKEWSLQGGTIKDETGEIDFTIWNRNELPQSLRNVSLTFKAAMGMKGGLLGLKVAKNKKDPSKIGLDVDAKAMISDKENSIQNDPVDDIDMSPPSEKRVEAPQASPTTTNNNSKSPQERIAQFGKLYKLCLKTACAATEVGQEDYDIIMDGSDVKDVASCLFISAMKEGLADKMELNSNEPF